MTGVFDKVLIESIGNGKPADLEDIKEHSVNRSLVFGPGVRPHEKVACRNRDHFRFYNHPTRMRNERINSLQLRLGWSVAPAWLGDQRINDPSDRGSDDRGHPK